MNRPNLLLAVAAVVIVAAGLSFGQWTSGQAVESRVVRRAAIDERNDEQAKTRLPQTHLVTKPYAPPKEPIALDECARVKKGQVVAQVVPHEGLNYFVTFFYFKNHLYLINCF
jgi:hypothetical protein